MYLVPYLVAGYDILWGAVKNIAHGELLDEEFLMAVATVGALAIGEFPEAVFVMIFYQIGEFFSDYASDKTRDSVSKLMDIAPEYATIKENGDFVRVAPESIEIGTLIYVKPGERIPVDGVVVEGSSALDTAALTGESVPQEISTGSEVFSGAINLSSLLTIKTTKEYKDSTVSKILELVEHAESKKSKAENFITKFARVYTPCVVASALILAVLPPLLIVFAGLNFAGSASMTTAQVWSAWIHRALIFLVVSCPCALVISVPLAFFVGIGQSAKKGVLVKGGNYLEALANVKTCVFDKTGTLTKGFFSVSKIIASNGKTEDEVLSLAARVENASNHPISLSVVQEWSKRNPSEKVKSVNDVAEIAGHGLSGMIDGKKVLCGNEKLMKAEGIQISSEVLSSELDGTVVHVAFGGEYAGCIVVSDEVKPLAKETLSELKKLGVSKTVMLTGDKKDVAEKVASAIGVDEVFSELLPQNKVETVEKLLGELGASSISESETTNKKEKSRGTLAFCGDGINDAPVLGRADIGIAMGSLGSDAAIEASDVVIMDDDISKIPVAVKIAKSTRKIAQENIWVSLAVKAAVLVLGALGIANMWVAIFADVGVLLLATLNSIRAGRIRSAKKSK